MDRFLVDATRDDDPVAAVQVAPRRHDGLRRHLTEEGVHVELVARARANGRWEAHVASADITAGWPLARWRSVNAPSAAVALDALQAELRQMIRGTLN